jgi:hypothetical protein
MGASSGGSPKPGLLGPDSLFQLLPMGKEGEAEVGGIKVRKIFPHRQGRLRPMGATSREQVGNVHST